MNILLVIVFINHGIYDVSYPEVLSWFLELALRLEISIDIFTINQRINLVINHLSSLNPNKSN